MKRTLLHLVGAGLLALALPASLAHAQTAVDCYFDSVAGDNGKSGLSEGEAGPYAGSLDLHGCQVQTRQRLEPGIGGYALSPQEGRRDGWGDEQDQDAHQLR